MFAPLFRFLNGLKLYAHIDIYADTPIVAQWATRLLSRPSVINSVPQSYSADLPGYLQRFDGILTAQIKNT